MNPHKIFVSITTASVLISITSLFSKPSELQGFLTIVIVSSTLLFILLLMTRKYWRGARSVGR